MLPYVALSTISTGEIPLIQRSTLARNGIGQVGVFER